MMKGIQTKSVIRKAAFRQFLTNGYDAVSLKEIEAISKMTRGCTLYHYPTKHELFMDVIDHYILNKQAVGCEMNGTSDHSLARFIDAYVNNTQSALERLNDFILPDVSGNATRGYMRLILQASRYYPDFKTSITQITQQRLSLWEAKIIQAQKSGEVNPRHDYRLVAKQFEYIFWGVSYHGALQIGLNTLDLKEQLTTLYNMIRS